MLWTTRNIKHESTPQRTANGKQDFAMAIGETAAPYGMTFDIILRAILHRDAATLGTFPGLQKFTLRRPTSIEPLHRYTAGDQMLDDNAGIGAAGDIRRTRD